MTAAALLTRLAGLWFLLGAMLKLFYGTPADLPLVGQDLSLDTALVVFKVVIAIEVLAGAAALLRPSTGWLPAAMLLSLFVVVTALQVVRGEESCGCFGTAVNVSPALMLGVDGGLLVVLLLLRPWRLRPGRLDLPWAAVAVVALAGIVLAVVIDRRAEGCVTPAPDSLVDLKVEDWKGMVLADTALCPWLEEEHGIEEGAVVIWRDSCEVCAEHLRNLAMESGEREILLVRLPKEFDDEKQAVDTIPEGAWVKRLDLPPGFSWWVVPPAHLEIRDGKIVFAVANIGDLLELEKQLQQAGLKAK